MEQQSFKTLMPGNKQDQRIQKTNTFTIRENAVWHDEVPVTADDVIFTYQEIIQNEAFPNKALHNTFKNVLIEKVDENIVTFTLKKPYKLQ